MSPTSTSTIMSTPLSLQMLLSGREQANEGGHEDQEDDGECRKELLEIGEPARRVKQ